MESQPLMTGRPPVLLERIAGLLIPPASREHVLGDLCERYRSPGSFVVDLLRTLPFVIGSNIRRTTKFAFWPLLGVMMIGWLGIGPPDAIWARGIVPTLATLFGFMVRDAYRVLDRQRPWRQGVTDALVVSAVVASSQVALAALGSQWVITPRGVAGFAFVLTVLCLLRSQDPSDRRPAPPAVYANAMSLADLRREVIGDEQLTRRGARLEIGVALVMLPILAAAAVAAPSPILKFAGTAAAGGVAVIVWYAWRHLRQPAVPTDAGFAGTVRAFQSRLERHLHTLRTYWRWYLLPLAAGPLLFVVGVAAAAPHPLFGLLPLLVLVALWGALDRSAATQARTLRERIDALSLVDER